MFNVAILGLLLGFSTSFMMAVMLRLAIGLGKLRCLQQFYNIVILYRGRLYQEVFFAEIVLSGYMIGYVGNGFMAIAKTCVSEICTKDQEMRGFGLLNGVWGE